MSDLPTGWEWVRLDEVAEVRLGRQRSPKNHTGTHMRPYLRAANVGWDGLKLDDVKQMNFTDAEATVYRLIPGDIVVAEASGSPGEVGKPAIWRGEIQECCLQNTLVRVRSYGIEPSYLLHYLRAEAIRGAFVEESRGVGINHLGAARLAAWPIALPPLAEQHRIVAALEGHLSRLDAGKRFTIRANQRAKTLSRALFDSISLGGMHNRTDSYNADCFAELEGRTSKKIDYSILPSLPEGWKWRVASEVCTSINSGSTPKAELMFPDAGEIPFLKVYNLTRNGLVDFTVRPTFVSRETHEGSLRRSRVAPGDVLTNIVGPPLGKTAVVPSDWVEWNINQAIVAFRSGEEIDPTWLAVVLQSPYILGLLQNTAKATAGQFNISLSTCRELPLPVPTLTEQRELTKTAQTAFSCIAASVANVEETLRRAELLHRSVRNEAFAGRLVQQDSNDEPASMLLNQIRDKSAATLKTRHAHRATKKIEEVGPIQETLL